MNRPTVIVFALAGLLGVFALIMVLRLPPPPNPVPKPAVEPEAPPMAKPAVVSQPPAEASETVNKKPSQKSANYEPVKGRQSVPTVANQKSGAPGAKAPIQDAEARVALGLVGMDLDAEEYWVSAINDPTLSAEERKDLIEDLNEEGLSDPKHPTDEYLELIANRLELIENLAPNSMDQVNFDAFQEAYKDLTDMLAGKPVK